MQHMGRSISGSTRCIVGECITYRANTPYFDLIFARLFGWFRFQEWKGDPRGRWDGDTLVVDTTNFTDKTRFAGSGPGLHVVERFTRTDLNTLRYEFTVDDPASFAAPWTGRLEMTRTEDRIYEYACHEGNYSMSGVLRGARSEERRNR